MESLGRFPRVRNVLQWKNIEGPLQDFLKANPWPCPRHLRHFIKCISFNDVHILVLLKS